MTEVGIDKATIKVERILLRKRKRIKAAINAAM